MMMIGDDKICTSKTGRRILNASPLENDKCNVVVYPELNIIESVYAQLQLCNVLLFWLFGDSTTQLRNKTHTEAYS